MPPPVCNRVGANNGGSEEEVSSTIQRQVKLIQEHIASEDYGYSGDANAMFRSWAKNEMVNYRTRCMLAIVWCMMELKITAEKLLFTHHRILEKNDCPLNTPFVCQGLSRKFDSYRKRLIESFNSEADKTAALELKHKTLTGQVKDIVNICTDLKTLNIIGPRPTLTAFLNWMKDCPTTWNGIKLEKNVLKYRALESLDPQLSEPGVRAWRMTDSNDIRKIRIVIDHEDGGPKRAGNRAHSSDDCNEVLR